MHISEAAYTVWNVTIPKEDRILPKFIWLGNPFYMKQLEELAFHRTHFTKSIQMKIPSGFPVPRRTSQRRCCQCLSQGMKSKLPRLTSKSPQQSVLNLSVHHFLKLLSLNLISATYQPQSLGKNAYKMIISSLVKWKLYHLSCKPQ